MTARLRAVAAPGSWRRVVASSVQRFADRVPEWASIVHWDFTPDNVLVQDGRVSGVIDWEGVRAGDPRFDLVTLAFYAPGTPLLEAELGRTDAGLRAVYQAHLCVRQAEWSLRRHDAVTGERMLRYALEVASGFPTV